MRKIEERIIKAINHHETVKLSELDRVVYNRMGEPFSEVWLHQTKIAVIFVDRVLINMGRWRNNTTKSRLNAILWEYCATGIYQKDFTWYLTYEPPRYVKDGMLIPRRSKRWDGNTWVIE
jgi:hypothetical protein